MGIELGFSDVESVLVHLNRVADGKRVAFRARLKHFQRLGFPEGVNTGTGRRATYGVRHLFQLVIAMEFTQSGMSPQRVVKTINGNWSHIETQILAALSTPEMYELFIPPLTSGERVLIVSPEALKDLTEEGDGEWDYHDSVDSTDIEDLAQRLKSDEVVITVGEFYRHVIIQLRPLAMLTVSCLMHIQPNLTWKAIYTEVFELVMDRIQRLHDAIASIDLKIPNVKDT